MARTVWKGALNFGLVNVPVGLYPSTQDRSIHFNQFEEGTPDRIRYKKVNERTGQEVEAQRIVRGIDVGGGEYVILSDEELEAAEPTKSKLIEITDFVGLDEIDPVYFRATYYLAPEGEAADKAYALLRQVMRNAGKVGIGTLVMRNKEYPVAVRPDDEVLKLETMYFADEIRSPRRELPQLPGAVALTERELSMAQLLLESMESAWDPARYVDTHRRSIEEMVEEKRKGKEIVTNVAAGPAETKVVDLMAVLNASIESVRGNRTAVGDPPSIAAMPVASEGSAGHATGGSTASPRRAPARKAPGSKTPARKAPARKAPARKAPVRKAAAAKASVKKAPAPAARAGRKAS